jgi:hypothetical protein
VAAPIAVPGAMAAMLAACAMNEPADAARAPSGLTYAMIGASDRRNRWTICRIELSRPPGVSIWTTSAL